MEYFIFGADDVSAVPSIGFMVTANGAYFDFLRNQLATRTEEMIPEVGGLRLGGPEEKGPLVSQRAQNHLYNYCNC